MYNSILDNYQCCCHTEQYPNVAANSCGEKWFNVIQLIMICALCPAVNYNFPRIVKSFEAIASSLVQKENFTSLVTTQNQTTLVAQKVCVMFISDVNR